MPDREAARVAFLKDSRWRNWARRPLAGDASNRRYERLSGPAGASVVLMDAPPNRCEDVGSFLRMAEYLSGLGLSAPAVLAAAPESGFLVLEDLGDALFARVLAERQSDAEALYAAAVEVLAVLHDAPKATGLSPWSERPARASTSRSA